MNNQLSFKKILVIFIQVLGAMLAFVISLMISNHDLSAFARNHGGG